MVDFSHHLFSYQENTFGTFIFKIWFLYKQNWSAHSCFEKVWTKFWLNERMTSFLEFKIFCVKQKIGKLAHIKEIYYFIIP